MTDMMTKVTSMLSAIKKYQAPGETDIQTWQKIFTHYEKTAELAPVEVVPEPVPDKPLRYRFKKFAEMNAAMTDLEGPGWQYKLRLQGDQLTSIIGVTPELQTVQDKMHQTYVMGPGGQGVINYENKIIPFATGMIEPY